MKELQIFNNAESGQIRTTEIDGKPYFVANDVAKALGYKRPADAVSASDSSILVRDLAKIIRQNGVQIGEKRLYKWM